MLVKPYNPIRHKNTQQNKKQCYQLHFVKKRKNTPKAKIPKTIFQSWNKRFRKNYNHLPTAISKKRHTAQKEK